MKFKNSKIYKEIKNSDKTFTLSFYTNTNIIINKDNLEFIIDVELNKLKEKINLVKEIYIVNENEMVNKIKDFYNSQINKPYLILEYAYFNKDNVDDGYLTIENSENFHEWLVE